MDFDTFLGKMQKLIISSQQGNLFGDKKGLIKATAESCEEFLKGQGYSVSPPHKYPLKITKLDDLIAMFYGSIRNSYPKQMWSYSNDKQDRAIAKKFVDGRMKDDGLSKETALEQCGLIIRTVLSRSDIFKFDTAPSFSIFGQANMGWITERAVQIINKQIAKEAAIATERAVDEMTAKIEEKYQNTGFSLAELTAMNKKLEEQYGKKERQT